MRLETIMSRGDLPASEKKLMTNFREGWGSPLETEWGVLTGCLLTFCLLAENGILLVQGQRWERVAT